MIQRGDASREGAAPARRGRSAGGVVRVPPSAPGRQASVPLGDTQKARAHRRGLMAMPPPGTSWGRVAGPGRGWPGRAFIGIAPVGPPTVSRTVLPPSAPACRMAPDRQSHHRLHRPRPTRSTGSNFWRSNGEIKVRLPLDANTPALSTPRHVVNRVADADRCSPQGLSRSGPKILMEGSPPSPGERPPLRCGMI